MERRQGGTGDLVVQRNSEFQYDVLTRERDNTKREKDIGLVSSILHFAR